MADKVPPDDSIMRYVPWAKLRKDADDNVIGILGEAFRMRDVDETLSATWVEYFLGERLAQITRAVQAIRASRLEVKPKSGFAVGSVGKIETACRSHDCKIRIVHEPEQDNAAHVAVRKLPRDNMDLFELLASEAWAELVLNKDVDPGAISAQ